MAESVREILVEIMELQRGEYERVLQAGEGESPATREAYRRLWLDARLELARHDAEQREKANG